jgi:hypothetical protein
MYGCMDGLADEAMTVSRDSFIDEAEFGSVPVELQGNEGGEGR